MCVCVYIYRFPTLSRSNPCQRRPTSASRARVVLPTLFWWAL